MAKKSPDGIDEVYLPDSTKMVTQNVNAFLNERVDPVVAAQRNYLNAQNRRKQLHKIYMHQEKVPMYMSPMYRPYTGNVMRVMINGISIFFKVDGSTQLIPKTFADEVVRRRKAIDRQLSRLNKMSNVPQNNESAPGELNLF